MLLSTHLIDEASPLMERVVVLDRGRLMLNASADDLRGSAAQALVVAVAIGLLAALTVVLLAGGFATVRRVTV